MAADLSPDKNSAANVPKTQDKKTREKTVLRSFQNLYINTIYNLKCITKQTP